MGLRPKLDAITQKTGLIDEEIYLWIVLITMLIGAVTAALL